MVLEGFEVCFGTFHRTIKEILAQIRLFLGNLALNKDMKCKIKIYRLSFRNILRLFDILPKFLFTATEAMHDYYL